MVKYTVLNGMIDYNNAKKLWFVAEKIFEELLEGAREITDEQDSSRPFYGTKPLPDIQCLLKSTLEEHSKLIAPHDEFEVRLYCGGESDLNPAYQLIGFELSNGIHECSLDVFHVNGNLSFRIGKIDGLEPKEYFEMRRSRNLERIFDSCLDYIRTGKKPKDA